MIKKTIIGAFLLFSTLTFAQEGTASPYSLYGIGEVRFRGTTENTAMGGLNVVSDSIHLNLQNPAAYSDLRLSTLSIGGTLSKNTLKSNELSANAQRVALDYMAIGMPAGKFGFGFGLIPYSAVGYKTSYTDLDSGNGNRSSGSGGLNKAYFGFGFKLTKNLRFGTNIDYNFGEIDTETLEYTTVSKFGGLEINQAQLSGVNFNFGLMHQFPINKKVTLFSSLNFTPESKLVSNNTRNIFTVEYDSDFQIVQQIDAFDEIATRVNLTLPSRLNFGSAIGENKKWMLGAEATFSSKGNLFNDYNTIANATFGSGQRYIIGGYFIPNYNAFSNYAKRIVYRAGLRFEKTGLIINNQSIDDLAATIGFGLPISGTFSSINLGLEYGKRGTTQALLVEENYFNMRISFSFSERWFIKRKYD
jgi:hypothetical protein